MRPEPIHSVVIPEIRIYRKFTSIQQFSMEIVNRLITQSLPAYLSNLPVPKSLLGFARLSSKPWFRCHCLRIN